MKPEYPIADMVVFPLKRDLGRLILMREADHLLRRFGQLELVDLKENEQTEFTARAEADRFLFPIHGSATVLLIDLREHSPSKGKRAEILFDAGDPHGLLVPFGVACSLDAKSAAQLVIVSTHSSAHLEDGSFSYGELAQYIAPQ